MKNPRLKFALIWFGFLFILLVMSSCKSKQAAQNSVAQKHYKFAFDSSVVKVTRTLGSIDSLFFYVPRVKLIKPECDSICQEKIDEILSNINSKKINGGNSSGFYYDKYKKMLVAYSNLKGSVDSISNSKKSSTENKYFNITKTITVNKLTKEQNFNVWTGRLFWLALFVYSVVKIRSKIITI